MGCSVVYNFASQYISVQCLSWICFESLGLCHTLEILGDGFLEMDGHWWSCLMIFILFFEIILRLMYPKSQNGVVVHVYNDMCKHV